MKIILVLVVVLALSGLIWRLLMAIKEARQTKDADFSAESLSQQLIERRKSASKGSNFITDPREAATVLMVEIARTNGDISDAQRHEIVLTLIDQLKFDEDLALSIIKHVDWATKEESGMEFLHRRMAKLLKAKVSEADLIELDFMLVQISEVEGQPTPDQLRIIATFRQITGIRT